MHEYCFTTSVHNLYLSHVCIPFAACTFIHGHIYELILAQNCQQYMESLTLHELIYATLDGTDINVYGDYGHIALNPYVYA